MSTLCEMTMFPMDHDASQNMKINLVSNVRVIPKWIKKKEYTEHGQET
jgi:hypothetical protein